MKNLSLFNKFAFLLNNFAALVLLFSYCAWFVNPSTVAFMGVVALAVPVFMAINFAFFLYWIVQGKKQFLLSTLCLLAGWWHFNALYQFGAKNQNTDSLNKIRIMTYNVHYYYAAFTWAKTYADPQEMKDLINEIDPDFFCIQEFQTAKKWVPEIKLKYKVVTKHQTAHLAIYSTYPIINSGEIDFPEKDVEYEKYLFADIVMQQDTIRLITAHLASIGLNNKDLQTFTQIENADDEKVKNSAKEIYKRLVKAYKRRGIQVNSIADFIAQSPHPVILCGDFNDTPTSYTYKKLTSQLQDAYKLAGSGIGATHSRFDHYNIPMRIDHIFADKKLVPYNWQVIKKNYSDHFPVVVDYELKN